MDVILLGAWMSVGDFLLTSYRSVEMSRRAAVSRVWADAEW